MVREKYKDLTERGRPAIALAWETAFIILMSQLRYDVTTRDWVVFAPERAGRPHDVSMQRVDADSSVSSCPFCPGREGDTSGEMLRIPDPADAGAWSVRVVANKFPALSPEAKLIFTERGRHFQEMEGYGAHEVAVESPDHFRPLALQPFTQIERVLEALQARYRTLMLVPGLRAIIVFKNHGPAAGTSLRHPHWQIIAPPAVPRLLREKHAIATSYFDHAFKRLHTVLLEEELAAGVRVLAVNDAFAAVLPYASHVPYQVRIQPRTYRGGFSRAARGDLQSLAAILREVLGRLYAALGDPAFNLNLVSPPITDEDEEYFQWHIDVLPRLMVTAGFEMGSGVAINPVPPEAAAEALRAAVPPTQDC